MSGLISVSDDFLGFGKIFGEKSGTAECGSRPAFGKSRNAYNECLRNVEARKKEIALAQIAAQKEIAMQAGTRSTSQLPIKYIAIGAVVVVVLIILLRKK